MTIRALVVDDEPAARRGLRLLLSRHPDVEVVRECATLDEIEPAVAETSPDVVFLDVRMPGGTAIEAFGRIPAASAPLVVLVTAFEGHALEAFDIDAVDYVLKPFTDESFDRALGRVRRQLAGLRDDRTAQSERLERIAIRSIRRVHLVDPAAVERVDADGDYVRIHTADGEYLFRETMQAMEERLAGEGMIRIHRSTLVRAEAIGEIQRRDNGRYVAVLKDGTRRDVSRSGQERLAEAFVIDL